MEVRNLQGMVMIVLLVGIALGVGIVVLDKLGIAAKESTPIINETITIASQVGTTANDDVLAISFFGNASKVFTQGLDYNLSANDAEVYAGVADGNYNISYTYDRDTPATTATSATVTELSNISSSWLGVIVIVMVAAIVLGLVISSFQNRQR